MQTAAVVDGENEKFAQFFKAPATDHLALDFGIIDRAFLEGLSDEGEPKSPLAERILLPADYRWTDEGVPRVPMALCEFVAYKAALAYENRDVVLKNVGGAQLFEFLDSNEGSDDGQGSKAIVADTQGFVFLHDGMVFVIMRGTEKRLDWTTNLDDELTDKLHGAKEAKAIKSLKRRYGKGVEPVLQLLASRPGRHMGFAIGWAAVHRKVTSFLDRHFGERARDIPIVIAGHSLGGALALIGASELRHDGFNVAAVITFGAPQVGNEAFRKEYEQQGLRERTVLFEAKGDTVPRLMRRWYYRLGRGFRQSVDQLIASDTARTPQQFLVVGNAWEFVAQPPLSGPEVEGAIRSIIEAKARKEKEAEERRAKEAQEKTGTAAAKAPEPGSGTTASAAAPASQAQPQAGLASPAADGKASAGASDRTAWLIIGAVVGLFVIVLFLIFVRSKLSAHAIMDRYALYLSTLSYQHIRALRASDPEPAAERLSRANADLARYMQFISGKDAAYFKRIKAGELPVRLKTELDLQTFLSESRNII
jgi:hypothetical protein